MKRSTIALLLGLFSALTLRADDHRVLRRGLAHLKLHGEDAQVQQRVSAWIDDESTRASDQDQEGRWIAADDQLVVVNGAVHWHGIGEIPQVRLLPQGQWVAAGSSSALLNGHTVDQPAELASLRRLWDSAPVAADVAPGEESSPDPRASEPYPLADDSSVLAAETLGNVVRDVTPPLVNGVELVLDPDGPRRRVIPLGGNPVFVGAETVGIRVTMSEPMGVAPRVSITQNGGTNAVQAGLVDQSRNPVFEFRFTPFTQPNRNGPVRLEVLGQAPAGSDPGFGVDRAGNPIPPGSPGSVVQSALTVDAVAPDLRRVDIRLPGQFRSLPGENEVLPKHGFPREILVLVIDYNQPDDGTFAGANIATDQASGVDFDKVGRPDGPSLRLFKPDGTPIPGTIVAAPPQALKLLLPDVYDPATGIFPDTDRDGRADPQEGRYRIEVDLVDKAGNRTLETLGLMGDPTPVPSTAIDVSIQPVFETPFPNPRNPIPPTGTAVKELRQVIVTSQDADFDFTRSDVKVLSFVPDQIPRPKTLRATLERETRRLVLNIERDQDGNGQPDFENPDPVPIPDDVPDPRFGKNDGNYLVEVTAFDRAGNQSKIERELLIDTTNPSISSTFPAAQAAFGPPFRIVDAILADPAANSGASGAGIRLESSNIRLRFLGNIRTPARVVEGLVFVHEPNPDDPTRPGFDPNDRLPKILYQIVDKRGDSVPLPSDGSMDGMYQIEVDTVDRAGNSATSSAGFTYSSTAPASATTAPLMLGAFQRR